MVRYIKCPRCELNYIDGDKQEYCDVCIAEMKGNKLQFADLDDDELLEQELEEEELCPVCGVNPIRAGESMCESCRKQQEFEEEEEVDIDKDEEWKNYLDEDEGDLTVNDEELEEELNADMEDDEEYHGEDEDDFDDVGSLDDLEDDDFDDDDEDDDEDDDDDDF